MLIQTEFLCVRVCVCLRVHAGRAPWRKDLIPKPCLSILLQQIRPPTPLRAEHSTRSHTQVHSHGLHWLRESFITNLCLIQLPCYSLDCERVVPVLSALFRPGTCMMGLCMHFICFCANGRTHVHVYTGLACLFSWENILHSIWTEMHCVATEKTKLICQVFDTTAIYRAFKTLQKPMMHFSCCVVLPNIYLQIIMVKDTNMYENYCCISYHILL